MCLGGGGVNVLFWDFYKCKNKFWACSTTHHTVYKLLRILGFLQFFFLLQKAWWLLNLLFSKCRLLNLLFSKCRLLNLLFSKCLSHDLWTIFTTGGRGIFLFNYVVWRVNREHSTKGIPPPPHLEKKVPILLTTILAWSNISRFDIQNVHLFHG